MADKVKVVKVQLERRIPQFEHVCPICGAKFLGAKVAVYDKPECRQKANWKRNGAKYNANRKAREGNAE